MREVQRQSEELLIFLYLCWCRKMNIDIRASYSFTWTSNYMELFLKVRKEYLATILEEQLSVLTEKQHKIFYLFIYGPRCELWSLASESDNLTSTAQPFSSNNKC